MTAAIDTDHVHSELHRFPEVTNLPLIVYHAVLAAEGEEAAELYEHLFARHGWSGGWRDGIYAYHHFHATQHEVLGIARGQAAVRFGGEKGPLVEVRAGDVVVVPAGVSHCREQGTKDLLVVGAYPAGQAPDISRGTPEGKPEARSKIAQAGLPPSDPVFGRQGPLVRYWSQRISTPAHDAPQPD
jgi:uncharacterized protein YjlB